MYIFEVFEAFILNYDTRANGIALSSCTVCASKIVLAHLFILRQCRGLGAEGARDCGRCRLSAFGRLRGGQAKCRKCGALPVIGRGMKGGEASSGCALAALLSPRSLPTDPDWEIGKRKRAGGTSTELWREAGTGKKQGDEDASGEVRGGLRW